MTTSFFIGRFQPLHNGHLNIIKQSIKENTLTIIAIGSSQHSLTKENPFTTSQRTEMILQTLKEEKIDRNKYLITHIPDIQNYALWVSHVENISPKFDKVYTGSPITRMLFENKGYNIINITRTQESSTKIRTLLKDKNKEWKTLVPNAVKTYLESIDAETLLSKIYEKDE